MTRVLNITSDDEVREYILSQSVDKMVKLYNAIRNDLDFTASAYFPIFYKYKLVRRVRYADRIETSIKDDYVHIQYTMNERNGEETCTVSLPIHTYQLGAKVVDAYCAQLIEDARLLDERNQAARKAELEQQQDANERAIYERLHTKYGKQS